MNVYNYNWISEQGARYMKFEESLGSSYLGVFFKVLDGFKSIKKHQLFRYQSTNLLILRDYHNNGVLST